MAKLIGRVFFGVWDLFGVGLGMFCLFVRSWL